MAVSVNTSGSQTATIGTEHTLATVTAAGVYQLVVDMANLALGDEVELVLYGKARSTDTERVLYRASFAHTQSEPLKASLAVVSPHHMRATLKQLAGTGRVFPWSIYALG